MPLSKEKKAVYFTKLETLLNTYTKVFIVIVDNVGSQQMQQTRHMMRGLAEILMGKNTLIRKIINAFIEKNPDHPVQKLLPYIEGNIGLVFTNSDLAKVKDLILKNKVPAPARVGAIAPVDVIIPAGPTGVDPGQTNFFQVLQIPTKIQKGQIEITNPVHLVKIGEKVGASEAALLQKLKINPFSYGFGIAHVYDNGSIFSPAILDITEAEILGKFSTALSKVASLSLQIGYPTQASIPHSIGQAFKALVAVTVQLDNYSFPEAAKFKAFLADPSAFAVAGPASSGSAGPAKPAAAAAPAEEVVDALEGGMNMFGAGGSDY